jgi:hypothetical protein
MRGGWCERFTTKARSSGSDTKNPDTESTESTEDAEGCTKGIEEFGEIRRGGNEKNEGEKMV